jgi:hypothetical protein
MQTGTAATGSVSSVRLAANSRPLIAALYRADSANHPVNLAQITLEGVVGDSVTVAANTTRALLESAGPDVEILVNISGTQSSYSLERLTRGAVVHRFDAAGVVTIRYTITRRVENVVAGYFELNQLGSAQVTQAVTPWVRAVDTTGDLVGMSCQTDCGPWTCTLNASSGSCGPSSWVISPYAAGSPFCCFQSTPGNGVSSTITITFSSPVSEITVTIADPTFAGNTVSASGPQGHVGSASFAFSGQSGQYSEDTKTISGVISTVVLTPAPADYVAYNATITVLGQEIQLTCSPSTVRGGNLTCTATPKTPPATLTMTLWRFTASTGGFVVNRTDNVSAHDWSGEVAAAGTIYVEGTVDGVQSSASATVAVTPRNWSSKTTLKDHSVIATTLSNKPAAFAELGNAVLSLPLDQNVNRWLKTISDNGPNHEFDYLIDLPPKPTSVSQVNTNAINGTSPFYTIQESKRKKISGFWYCPKSVVTGVLLGLSEKHEGAVPDPDVFPNSHPSIYRRHVDSVAYSRYEPLVGFQGQDFISTATNTLHTQASNNSAAMDNDSRNYINYNSLGNCDHFHFGPYPP